MASGKNAVNINTPLPPQRVQAPHYRFAVRWANDTDLRAITGYLERDPALHLYTLAWLERTPGIFSPTDARSHILLADLSNAAQSHVDDLLGLCLVVQERMVIPTTPHPDVARAMGRKLLHELDMLEHVVGERDCAATLWETFGQGKAPRLDQPQHFMCLEGRMPQVTSSLKAPLRQASLHELDMLIEASAQMYREETLSDPLETNPELFARMLETRIRQRRMFLWCDNAPGERRRLLFKADVSTSYSGGAMISGVFTAPEHRRQGVAKRAMATLCRRLLARYPRVALYVNAHNTAAIGLYEKLGFVNHSPYRTIFVD